MKIKRIPVTSSQIAAIGYNPASEQMDVEFVNRKPGSAPSVYRYENVTQKDMNSLVGAESIGSHFINVIKADPKRWPFRKLKAEEAKQ